MDSINYENIETISDTVMILSADTYLRMNVRLGYKDKDNFRQSYMKGYVIPTQKYRYSEDVISIKRNFSYYLSIEKATNQDMYIQIRPSKMMILKHLLNEAGKWILDSNLWGIKNNKLIMKGRPQTIYIEGMSPNNKTIALDPIVNVYNDVYDKAIQLSVVGVDDYINIGSDTFMGLLYIISTIDLYTAASTLINSIPVYTEPQFVKQLVYIQDDDSNINEGISKAVPNRTIKGKNNKSFFDD